LLLTSIVFFFGLFIGFLSISGSVSAATTSAFFAICWKIAAHLLAEIALKESESKVVILSGIVDKLR
jgi:hypothetical protein